MGQPLWLLFHCRRMRRDNIAELRVNGNIRTKEVRVVAPDGSQIGVKKIEEALWLAEQLDLDLVEVAPGARPPVCKIMDYGKYKYEQSVRDREARKKQTRTVIKEVRMKPRIGDHDYEMLMRRSLHFLTDGDKVKVTIRFRGRENERPELGLNLINRLLEDLGEYATVEQTAAKEGRTMTSVIAPTAAARALKAQQEKQEKQEKAEAEGDSSEEEPKPVSDVSEEPAESPEPDGEQDGDVTPETEAEPDRRETGTG